MTAGVTGVTPPTLDGLVRTAGSWPVLLGLVNGQPRELVADGADPDEAAIWLADRLARRGPTALDTADPRSRGQAVAATVGVSLGRLSAAEQARLVELAVLPEDVPVPGDVVDLLWAGRDGLTSAGAQALRRRLVALRLLGQRWADGEPAVVLHDVLRDYFAGQLSPAETTAAHRRLVDAARSLCAGGPTAWWTGTAWWTLPADAGYLWRHLVGHLLGAGLADEADRLGTDLRWVEVKTRRLASTVPAEADLALLGTPLAAVLGRALGQLAHLLTPIDPPTALGASLASRLTGVDGLGPLVEAYRPHLAMPRLESRWPLPDQPDPALRRTIDAPSNGLYGCAFSPDGTLVATAASLTTVLWDVETGRPRRIIEGHDGAAYACAFSPDGTLLATATHDGAVLLWEVASGRRQVAVAHPDEVSGCAFSPDGRLLATVCFDRAARVWTLDGRCRAALRMAEPLLACAWHPRDATIAAVGRGGVYLLAYRA